MALARALYKDCEILVVDEVTSALHEEMAQELEREILELEGRLVFHMTHRLGKLYDGVVEVAGDRAAISCSHRGG